MELCSRKPKIRKIRHTRTESEIQDRLYWWLYRKSHDNIAPNVYLYDWESDMFSVTKAGYAHEYEIKISLSDFRADATKLARHQALATGARDLTEHEQDIYERFKDRKAPQYHPHWIHERLTSDRRWRCARPNYFWYVSPWEVIPLADCPAHAGLLWVHERGHFVVQRDAPKLHKEPVTPEIIHKIDVSFRFKYWRARTAK